MLDAWRQRPLAACPYLLLDARYEKVRQGGVVQDAAVLIAMGVDAQGKRQVLGVSVALSEKEVHWRSFLQSLVQRGRRGVRLIVSDAHEGLKAARLAVLGGIPWQRCQFHLQQSASAYVPRQDIKAQVAADIRAVFSAQDRAEADALLKRTVQKYAQTAPRLAAWMEENLPEGLTVFALPEPHHRLLRTTNSVERVNREVRRRTRVAKHLPERGVVPAAGERGTDGDQRRLAGGQSLLDLHGTGHHEPVDTQGCSQLLQKQLDTIPPPPSSPTAECLRHLSS